LTEKLTYMKKYIFGIIFLAFLAFSGKSQQKLQISNDTIVYIVDTLQPFVKFGSDSLSIKTNPANQIPWLITVQCHYFDSTWTSEKESAKITFLQKNESNSGKNFPLRIKLSKKVLSGRYLCVPDYWIHNQLDINTLYHRLWFFNKVRYDFVVFKNELDDPQRDSVNMYAVGIGWCEIIE